MSACATGCVQLGSHTSACTGLDAATAECRGCTPREAAQGVLCGRCWGNLQRDVRTAPSIVDWIREHVLPSGQQALIQESTVKIRGPRTDSEGPFYIGLASPSPSAEGSEPLSADATDAADELHAHLASWALLILEEHPGRLVGPRVRRQRRSLDGSVVGIMPGRISPDETEPDRAEPRRGVATPRIKPMPGIERGERCALSDLLVTQCACRIHRAEESA